jgi:hypothetical protein
LCGEWREERGERRENEEKTHLLTADANSDSGVRVLSLFTNSILSCLIFTRRRRHEPTTIQAIQTTELY